MKKTLTTIIVLICVSLNINYAYSQSYAINLDATILQNISPFTKGDEPKFAWLRHVTRYNEFIEGNETFFLLEDAEGRELKIKGDPNKYVQFHYKNTTELWDSAIILNNISYISKNGTQHDLRSELEQDVLDYIQKVNEYQLVLNDPYLESYIYSLISKIAPSLFADGLIDGRAGNVNVLIIQDPQVNACCFPNGTIVLNTGLLSRLHTEDELVAILSHEIAHYVLDHSIHNVTKAEQRQKRAAFWAAVTTGIAAIAETAIATSSEYYTPGAVTLGTAIISSVIACNVIERLGMEYNHEQEYEADLLSRNVLTILGYDAHALDSVLKRIQNENILYNNNAINYLNSYTHPALVDRININEGYIMTPSKEFEQMMSFAITNTAIMAYNHRRFNLCKALTMQNIHNNVATADDYILQARTLLAISDTEKSNNEALQFAKIAQQLDPNNINGYKIEILVHLRKKNYTEALALLEKFHEILNSVTMWDRTIAIEQDWTQKMLAKVRGFIE